MNVYRYRNTAPAAAQQPETPLYAAGYHLTPGRIGAQRVKAYIVAVVGLAATYASIRGAAQLQQPAIVLLGLAAAGGCAIYAWSIVEGIADVRRTLWRREEDSGQDIDDDGHVGQPPVVVGRILPIGRGDNSVTLPDLNPVPQAIALNGFPTDPPIAPNDVVYILTHAAAGDGLSFRAWDKRRLPSGAEIKRDLWIGILDGLIQWNMATASETADGRRVVTLRNDVDIEVMIQYIRSAVEPEDDRVVS